MPEPLADDAARLQALDPLGSYLVQAPAGSGKTELLMQRFLRLLTSVEEPESVVAVTFTRKATAELQGRLIQALKTAKGARPEEPHLLRTWELARAVLAHDEAHRWQLLDNPSRLRILTIDGLCSALVRQMPWLSRFGGMPRIEPEPQALYRRAVRQLLQVLEAERDDAVTADALAVVLDHLNNNTALLERLLLDLLAGRDQWLRHVAGRMGSSEADRLQLRNDLEGALQAAIRAALQPLRAAISDAHLATLCAIARQASINLENDPPAKPPDARLVVFQKTIGWPGSEPDDIPAWCALGEILLTKEGKPRKAPDKRVGFTKQLRAQLEDLLRAAPVFMDPPWLAQLHDVRGLPPATYGAQWPALEALFHLLPRLVAALRVTFQDAGAVDYIEVSLAARLALGTPETPTDLAFALDARLQHLLVDEFQDTSHGQFELVRALTAEWQPEDGRTLFLVGDPMQSIYGFREAEVGLFLRVQNEAGGTPTPGREGSGLEHLGLQFLPLTVNFRSTPGLVDWFNRIFHPAFPAMPDALRGAVPFHPATTGRVARPGPDVTTQLLLVPAAESASLRDSREAEWVSAIVQSAIEDDDAVRRADPTRPPASIAILVRARSHLPAILTQLRRDGITYQAVKIGTLLERPVVQDLLALTRALLHPADRIAWLALLRARWCGLTLADLWALCAANSRETLWERLNNDVLLTSLSKDGQQRVRALRLHLTAAVATAGRIPLRRLVETAWLALGGPACAPEAGSRDDAAAFFARLEQTAAGAALPDIDEFEQGLEKLRAAADPGGRVQVLTMHDAKGLEFDTVIVPGLGRRPPTSDAKLLLWLECDRGPHGLLLAPIKAAGTPADPVYDYLKEVRTLREKFESTRLLYVALTRARNRLHVVGHVKVRSDEHGEVDPRPESRSLLAAIWTPAAAEFMRNAGDVAVGALAAAPRVPLMLCRVESNWQPPVPPAAIAWTPPAGPRAERPPLSYRWVGELQRHVGTVVHAALQRLAATHRAAAPWDEVAIRAALRAEGIVASQMDEAIARVSAATLRTLADARGRWILAAHDEAANEFELAGVVEGGVQHVLLDRTFVEGGVRWIIDYKTSAHEGGGLDAFLDREQGRYRQQLETYAQLMAGRDERPIRLGLYFPLLGGWREWTAGARRAATTVDG